MFTCVHLRVFTSTRARNPGRSNASGSSVIDLGGTGRERERERPLDVCRTSALVVSWTDDSGFPSFWPYVRGEKKSATNAR